MSKVPSCLSSKASLSTRPERTLRAVGCASRLARSIIPDPPQDALCTSRDLVYPIWSARQVALVDHLRDVDRLLEPLQLLEHEPGELLEARDVDAGAWIALPVGVLEVNLQRRAHEPALVQITLGLGGVGEVVLRDGDVIGEESTHRVRVLLEELVAEPDIEQLVVVADGLDGGEDLAQAAPGELGGIEGLDEGPGADLAGAHRVAHPGEGHGKDLGVLVGDDAGVEQSGTRPEIGGRLDADHADGADRKSV